MPATELVFEALVTAFGDAGHPAGAVLAYTQVAVHIHMGNIWDSNAHTETRSLSLAHSLTL